MGRGVMGVGVALLLAACAREAPPRQSDALERSARILAKLDQLEADLHDEGSKIGLYGELEGRHRQVSQIACQVSAEHVEEIHRLALAQEAKQMAKAKKRRAVAAARLPRHRATAMN